MARRILEAFRLWKDNGRDYATDGAVAFWVAGTGGATPAAPFRDEALNTPFGASVPLDSLGYAPDIWGADDVSYGITWSGTGVTTRSFDNFSPATAVSESVAASTPSFKNVLRNGAFSVWSNGAAFSNVSGAGAAVALADGWFFSQAGTAANAISRQTADSIGAQYGLRFGRPNASGSTQQLRVYATIATDEAYRLRGQDVTFSFSVKSGANFSAAALALLVATGTSSGEDGNNMNSGSWGGQVSQLSTTQIISTALARFQFTVSIPANAGEVGVQFAYTPTGVAGANDWVQIEDVMLEVAEAATAMEAAPESIEFIRASMSAGGRQFVASPFSDPGADVLIGWDDSAGAIIGFTLPPAGIATTGTGLVLANDLAAYEGLATTGLVVRTADGAATTRAITGTANEISVANGDGVAGAPTLSLPASLTFTGKTVTGGTYAGIAITGASTAPTQSPGDNSTKIATTAYADAAATAIIAASDAMVFKGVIDCSANPNYPAADRGNTYRVSVAGKIGGASGANVEAGDILLCLTDGTLAGTQAAVGASWSVVQANIDGAVIGPASVNDGDLALFNGATGKLIKSGGAVGTNWLTAINAALGANWTTALAAALGAGWTAALAAAYSTGQAASAVLTSATLGPADKTNFSIAASVSGNALTFALKGRDGNDPSAGNPVYIPFRSATLTDGKWVLRAVTAALSVTVSSGSTLGTANATAARVRCLFIDNAGTVELAVVNCALSDGVLPLDESALISTTAEGGAGAADSAGVIYSTTARTNVAFRFAGYAECTEATAGTWATAPAVVHTALPGERKPGDVVGTRRNTTGASASTTTVIPVDNTIPQNTEGAQFMSQAITPTSAINMLRTRAGMQFAAGGAIHLSAALYQDSTANAFAALCSTIAGGAGHSAMAIEGYVLAGTTSATTMKLRGGPASAATLSFNCSSGGTQVFGGVAASFIEVAEILV